MRERRQESIRAGQSRDGSGRGARRLKWHHFYYLLAAFDVLTVSFSLYLNHRILGIYTESVLLNQHWAERMAHYSALAQMAAMVNAPGNDVFDSQEPVRESERMRTALSIFDRSFAEAQTDLRTTVEAALAAPLLQALDRVAATMLAMVSESQLIFAYFQQNEPEKAGRRMAEMDRKYGQLRAALDAVERDVREIQKGNFARQTALAVTSGRFEYVIGGFIVLMVIAITVYGYGLATRMESHEKEREHMMSGLQEVEARTRAIVDTAAEGILTVGEGQQILSMNAAAERIFGYRAVEVIGREGNTLLAPPEEEVRPRPFEELPGGDEEAGSVRRLEVEGLRKDGTKFPMDLAISRVRVGARPIVTAIVRDLTDRKRVETLTRRYSEELEARVRESTEHLEAALSRQSELARKNAEAYEVIRRTQEELVRKERLAAVGEIAAAVAHGIRNPLASIRAAAEVGRDDFAEDSSLADVIEVLRDIVTEVNRLETRIRGVLDFARPFEPKLTAGDVNEFIGVFAEALRKSIPETIRLVVELDSKLPIIDFDRAYLYEALEAIVVNAVEAMGASGEVTLRSSLEREEDEPSVALLVADTGPGIEPSRLERIFDLFYTSKPSGTGVGLAMAKRLVESQGGRIEVASEPGQTTFTVRLPVPRNPTVIGA